MSKKDYLLIFVLYGSLITGVFFPQTSESVSSCIKYLMMGMLFLSFIKISPSDVWQALVSHPVSLFSGTIIRLVIAPALTWYITRWLYPPLSLPMLLLAGVSTGVSSPFFTSLCRGDISYCLIMAVVTSLLVPVSLPLMVRVLARSSLDYDLSAMAFFLSMIILVPLSAAFACRYIIPNITVRVNHLSYPISLGIIAVINFGALGRYIHYLKANPEQIFFSALFAAGLALVMAGIGWAAAPAREWAEKVASSGSQVWLNNVLIIALAVQIDQPLAATLGAFYFIPLYGFVIFFSLTAAHTRFSS